MAMFEIYNIVYSTQPPVYYPGQPVTGYVNLKLKEDMQIRNIRIEMDGKAFVHWIVRRKSGKTHRTYVYQNGRDYFSQQQLLWGKPFGPVVPGEETPTMPAGHFSLPFQLVLPYDIPFSFEGSLPGIILSQLPLDAYVRYQCKVVIATTTALTYEVAVPFTVVNLFDLNNVPHALTPAQAQNQITARYGFFKSAPITIKLNIPVKTGFVPGEKIPIEGEISNESELKIKSWRVDLLQTVLFHGVFAGYNGPHQMTRDTKTVVATYRHDEEIPEKQDTPIACELQVPAVPSSELLHCDFIVIQYVVDLHVNAAQSSFLPFSSVNDMTVGIPVIIGNIPVRSEWNQIAPASLQPPPIEGGGDQGASAPAAPSAPVAAAPYDDMPPPSYHEAFGASSAISNAENNESVKTEPYKPLYPTYTWNAEK